MDGSDSLAIPFNTTWTVCSSYCWTQLNKLAALILSVQAHSGVDATSFFPQDPKRLTIAKHRKLETLISVNSFQLTAKSILNYATQS